MISLAELEVSPTAEIQIRDANGERLPGVVARVYGPGSQEYASAAAAWRRRNKTIDEYDDKAMLDSNARFLSDITLEFVGVEYNNLGGKELADAIYHNQALGYISKQILAAVSDWGKFSRRNTSPSTSTPVN